MRICWADDKLEEARTFSQLLDALNPTIDFAADGHAALDLLGAHPYDLLILDLQMPPGDWGGLWLLEKLQNLPFHAPALVLSGEGTQHETIDAVRLGAVDYVQKARVADDLEVRVLATTQAALTLLIEGAESETVEFKETLRWDVKEKRVNKGLEKPTLKTIAAFANSSGGTLVIGRADHGEVTGIASDLAVIGDGTEDGFEVHLRNLITGVMGADTNQLVRVRFHLVQGFRLAVVGVGRSHEPVFVRDGGTSVFYVRAGNGTRSLDPEETFRYIARRFK